MKRFFLLAFPFVSFLGSNAQIEAKIEYPLVPIADECHLPFDDTSKVQIISTEELLNLNRIWFTQNSCYNHIDDTIYAKNFTVTFFDISDKPTGTFPITDGSFQTPYLSSLVESIQNAKSYEKILFSNIQYELDGVLYQTSGFTLVIDSLVYAKTDPCWSLFPKKYHYTRNITKEELIALVSDSLGYNSCTKQLEWADSSTQVKVIIGSRTTINNQILNIFQAALSVNPQTDKSKLIDNLKNLNSGDLVRLSHFHYLKNNEYYTSSGVEFKIVEDLPCGLQIDIETIDSISLSLIDDIVQQLLQNKAGCIVSSKVSIQSLLFIFVPKKGDAQLISQSGTHIRDSAIAALKKLVPGDYVVFEKIKYIDEDGSLQYRN